MGVAVEDGGEFSRCGIEVEGLEIMEHIDVAALAEEDFSFGQPGAGAIAIDIAADSGDGRDFGQLIEDGDFADVANVEDAIDAAQCGSDLRAEETVGVGDDAEEHGFRISGSGIGGVSSTARSGDACTTAGEAQQGDVEPRPRSEKGGTPLH